MSRSLRLAAALALALALLAPSRVDAAAEVAHAARRLVAAGGLARRGTDITYKGTPAMLRGVNVGTPALRSGRPATDYKRLASGWHANVARLIVHTPEWRDTKPAVLAGMDREVPAILAAGMFVILDLHAQGWPDGYNDAPSYDSVEAWVAKDYWLTMARKYGRDGRVVFELWNEPQHGPDTFSDPPGKYWTDLKRYYDEWVRDIRGTGARNLILAANDQRASNLYGVAANPVDDPIGNIAYVMHFYPPAGSIDDITPRMAGVQRTWPIVVTEWGYTGGGPGDPGRCGCWEDDVTGQWHKQMYAWLERYAAGWLGWSWTPAWTPVLVKPDWATPTSSGSYMRTKMRLVASPVRP